MTCLCTDLRHFKVPVKARKFEHDFTFATRMDSVSLDSVLIILLTLPLFLGIIYLGGKLIDRLYQVFYSIGKDQEASKWRKHQDSRTARA